MHLWHSFLGIFKFDVYSIRCWKIRRNTENMQIGEHFFVRYKLWILPLQVKHNIIYMFFTEPLIWLNHLKKFSYYFSAYLRQQLDNDITIVGFQLGQSLRIVCVNRLFHIAAQKEMQKT